MPTFISRGLLNPPSSPDDGLSLGVLNRHAEVSATLSFAISCDKAQTANAEVSTYTVTAAVGGSTQTSLSITVTLDVGFGTCPVAADETLDGWSNAGWSAIGEGTSSTTATFTKASAAVGSPSFTFTVLGALSNQTRDCDLSAGSSTEVADATEGGGTTVPHYFWATDATATTKAFPADATQDTALNTYYGMSSVASSIHLCQEASGNLADTGGGSVTLTANGTVSYSNAISGYTRVAVGTTNGTAGRFTAGSGSGPNPASVSFGAFCVAQITSVVSSERAFFWLADAANDYIGINVLAAGQLKVYIDNIAAVTSANVYEAAGVFAFLLLYDRTNSRARLYTTTEALALTYGSGVTSANKHIGGTTLTTPATSRYLYSKLLSGSAVEALNSDAAAKAYIQNHGHSVSGY